MHAALAALAEALINDQNVSEDTRSAAKNLLEAAQQEQDMRLKAVEIINGM